MTFAEIQNMKKCTWKSIIKTHIAEQSLHYLNNLKQKHSKVNKLKHQKLSMQSYFLPSENDMTKDEIQLIFQMRSKVTKVKMNMKGLYDTMSVQYA